ncbi:MAG: DUF4184 family protein [Bacteroidota bacterium]
MPLTFAHPAAVLPLARLRLPLSALVVGSVSPDLIYFVRLAPRGDFGHTLPGLFLSCLPAGLALLWMLDRMLKRPLAELAPATVQRRLAPVLATSPFDGSLLTVGATVLIGAVTHVAWDSFTHAGEWGVRTFPILRDTMSLGPLGRVPLYKLAQHGSTLIGLSALAAVAVLWWRNAPEAELTPRLTARTRAVRILLMASVALATGITYAAIEASDAASPLPTFLGRFVVSTTSAGLVLATGYSVWVRSRMGSTD